ncbi:MAG TPA: universal stress protein, partial [Chloroflexota bacterium]|nr:universal stress protein [Chloroflexota bacterium]
ILLTPPALAPGGPEGLLQPLLIPLDGSALSEQILPVAKRLASCVRVPVTFVRAVEADSIAGFPARAVAPYGVELQGMAREAARRAAQADLETVARSWRQDGIDASVAVERGDPAAVIGDIAAKTKAGWLAMASHGRGGLSGLLLGSTALRVLQHVALPALIAATPIVEPDQRADPPPDKERETACQPDNNRTLSRPARRG